METLSRPGHGRRQSIATLSLLFWRCNDSSGSSTVGDSQELKGKSQAFNGRSHRTAQAQAIEIFYRGETPLILAAS